MTADAGYEMLYTAPAVIDGLMTAPAVGLPGHCAQMKVRKSPAGKYGKTGFEWVFVFEDSFKVMGFEHVIYVKGFFFEIHSPRGVEIQSFKKSRPKLKSVT